jgi:pimeloyl-ACP methyl ester carboxylesterase
MTPARFEVRSADGTVIPVFKSGSGPALVMVHGAAESHSAWSRLLPYLEPHCTVLTMDRRASFLDASIRYDLEREFEDVAAAAGSVEGPVSIVGASSGAVCALGAAVLIDDLRRLILYEPPLVGGQPSNLEEMEHLVDLGDLEGAAESFLRDAVKLSKEAIEAMKAGPRWSDVVATAPLQIREVAVLRSRMPDVQAFARRRVPALFLTGEKTPPSHHHRRYIEVLKSACVELTVVAVQGQEHFAYRGAPELFSELILEYLEA